MSLEAEIHVDLSAIDPYTWVKGGPSNADEMNAISDTIRTFDVQTAYDHFTKGEYDKIGLTPESFFYFFLDMKLQLFCSQVNPTPESLELFKAIENSTGPAVYCNPSDVQSAVETSLTEAFGENRTSFTIKVKDLLDLPSEAPSISSPLYMLYLSYASINKQLIEVGVKDLRLMAITHSRCITSLYMIMTYFIYLYKHQKIVKDTVFMGDVEDYCNIFI